MAFLKESTSLVLVGTGSGGIGGTLVWTGYSAGSHTVTSVQLLVAAGLLIIATAMLSIGMRGL